MQETPAIFDATPFARYQETPLPGVARPGSHAVWWQRAFRAADDIFMDTATWLTGNQPSLLVLMFPAGPQAPPAPPTAHAPPRGAERRAAARSVLPRRGRGAA